MTILVKLLLAHFIGDFLVQPKSWVEEKELRRIASPKLYLHILIHGALILLLLWNFDYWLPVLLLMVFHGIIDIAKLYAQKEGNKAKWFLFDQGLHLTTLLIFWFFWFNSTVNLSDITISPNVWIYITALLFLTSVSGVIIQVLMTNWSRALNESTDESLINAGKYIGILERLFVFTFIVTGHWEAIGFLMASKSIFRFGDLKESKDRKLTEYILIGTLLSFGIATATGLIVVELTAP